MKTRGRCRRRWRGAGRWGGARRTALSAGLALLAGAVSTPGPLGIAALAAQTGDPDSAAAQVGCFRGRPLPACKSFWLIEMQGYTPLVQSSRTVIYGTGSPSTIQTFESNVEWNVGHMVNLTPDLALGGTVSVGPHGGSGIFTGLKVRARRWISPSWSVELAGGLLESGARHPSARGVTLDARVNIRDQGGFFVRWDGVSLSEESGPDGRYYDSGGFQQAFSVGAVAGSAPALIGTGALGVGYLILLGAFLSNAS